MVSRSRLLHWLLLYCIVTLLLLLAACGGGEQQVQPPPPTSSFSLLPVTFDLGIPDAAMHSTVVGDLPGTTLLHVTVTFKTNGVLLKQLDKQQTQGKQRVDLQ